ncbi:GNAT family N-acetyltransferase [Streptomyces sp. NPDC088766]|uniref:GNAT family N-acetyltransferase n=1 Tax=Streptomyces sp. NPDC088766 TaxID=3365893 RepID=UPI0037F189C2
MDATHDTGPRAVRPEADATASAPALLLRPWRVEDAAGVAEAYRDPALRRRASATVRDETEALRRLRTRHDGRETGERLAFAVLQARPDGGGEGRSAGHVVLKAPHGPEPEVGYWTAAPARGRGVAPRALGALTHWAFTALPEVTRLRLLHTAANTASCRVAERAGYGFEAELLPAPTEFPSEGHLHVRTVSGRAPA